MTIVRFTKIEPKWRRSPFFGVEEGAVVDYPDIRAPTKMGHFNVSPFTDAAFDKASDSEE